MSAYKCPFAKKVPLQCDVAYSLDEEYRQLKQKFDSGKEIYLFADDNYGPKFVCANDPELCPRYIQHLVTNIDKYKQH